MPLEQWKKYCFLVVGFGMLFANVDHEELMSSAR
jgi:hypothetical protein